MTGESQWPELDRLLGRAIELKEDERDAFVSQVQPELRPGLEELLAIDAQNLAVLDEPPWGNSSSSAYSGDEFAESRTRVGEHLGAYELVGELGRGGMATVYRARRIDHSFNRDVAIKVLRAVVEETSLRRRFRAEQQILAGLEHPSIARLFDGGVTDDGAPFLILELVDGEPIDTYCAKHQCNLAQRLELFGQVCEAVAYAHQELVVHRDLKPSNILVDARGKVRLLDFGIAKLLGAESPDCGLTGSGLAPLTPRFASPEQLRGEPVSTASDVFSLGALLYLLTTGQTPFAKTVPERLQELVLDREPIRPSDVATDSRYPGRGVGGIGGDLDAILRKSIRNRREDRYQTVQDLVADLERAREGDPVLARQGNWIYLSGRWIRRNRIQLAAAGVLLAFAALWLLSATRQAAANRRQRDLATQEARKATQTSEFLVSLFAAGAPNSSEEADVSVRDLLDRGAQRARDELADQPVVLAEMLDSIGESYLNLSLAPEANALVEEAVAIRLRVGEPDVSLGRSYRLIGIVRFHMGKLPEAVPAFREAIDLCRGRDVSCHGEALTVLGELLINLGESQEGLDLLNEAHALYSSSFGPDAAETLKVLVALGSSEINLGHWQQAQVSFSKALSSGSFHANDAIGAADATDLLGKILLKLGRPAEALAMHQQVLPVVEELLGANTGLVAANLQRTAAAQLALGDLEAAETSVNQALEILQQLFPAGHPWISFTQVVQARIFARQGRGDEAAGLFSDAISVIRRTIPGALQTVGPLTSYGEFLIGQGRFDEAREILAEAQQTAGQLPADSGWLLAVNEALGHCERAESAD